MSENPSSASSLRCLMRMANHTTLATIASGHTQVSDGWPVTSMVVHAIASDGTPLLLISELADHTRHILADDRVSLLFAPYPFRGLKRIRRG
jgi:heme iron utilization protein